ncbi:MAG: hypothetical protein IJX76_06135 [Clostridia bacterium]|nr:hypothetical protein [Clostridia bacterium]
MRRDDEAFKKEIFRRYGVQKRNRRNLRLLATAPLIFCVFIAGVLWLPTILGMLGTAPVADEPEETTTVKEELKEALPEEHPLAKYLNRPIEEVYCAGGDYYTLHTCTKDEIDEMLTKILKLSISKTNAPSFSSGQSMPYLFFKFTDTSTVQLSLDPSGSIQLLHSPGDETLSKILEYYQIPTDEMAEFASYLRMMASDYGSPTLDEILASAVNEIRLGGYKQIADWVSFSGSAPETTTVMGLLRELDLTMPDVSSLNWYPETAVRLVLDQYAMDVSVDPYTGWLEAKLFDTNDQMLSASYYRTTPAKAKTLVICVEELLHGESSLSKHPTFDPDQVWNTSLNSAISSIHLSSFSTQSHSHSCSAEEIERIVAELKKLTKSKSEPMVNRPSGATVTLAVRDVRIVLMFDPSGYMEMRCFSADYTQTRLFQGYKIPADEVAAFAAVVEEIMYGTQTPPEPQYPMLEDLLTFLHPTANALYVYPHLASSIRYEYSGTGEEIAYVLTSLRNMAPTRLSDSFSTDVSGRFAVEWVLDEYSAVVLLDPDNGFIRFNLISPDGEQLAIALYSAPAADVAALAAYVEGLTQPTEQ